MVVEKLAYDPWGKRRFINGTADTLDAITGQTIDRGFTMHEHIDEMGIINMNGRIYDPLIGRFMSADPYIQAPDDLQSHNRYAYVMNNPLNLTDPSGFNWLSKAWKKAWKSPIFKAVLGIVVAVVAPYALTWLAPTLFAASSLPLALATGALSGFASTGTLKGALTGAFTAGIMFGVGTISADLTKAGVGGFTDGGIGKIALHAGAGCLSSVAGGGECKSGAISGGFGEFGHNIDVGPGAVVGTIKSAMMGGVGSKLAGGKFADGVTTGAFGYLFNFCMHDPSCTFREMGERIGNKIRDILTKTADVVSDAIAVCGVVAGPCRAADTVLSVEKAAIKYLVDGDTKPAQGVVVGEGASKAVEAGLTVANATSVSGLKLPSAVVRGAAYVGGKIAELQWMEPPKPQK